MKYIKDKKVIGLLCFLVIIFIISLLTYGKTKSKVFKDEYMKNIFVEAEAVDEIINNSEDTKNGSIALQQSVQVDKETIVVEIKGEVLKPDVYILKEGSIIKDLIDMAGGLTEDADISSINRAQQLNNHELIIINNINNINNRDELQGTVNPVINSVSTVNDGLISINTANESELKQIPGVGDVKAKAIIGYREANGGFKSIDEMKNIDGIGEKTFEKMKDKIKL